jgi:glycosyltransferase involved in cell wall biosynthesis
MSQRPVRISVITAVYNNAATIAAALESTLSQNHSNVELIVIDGGSTDGTLDVVACYRDRISVFVSEPDRGIYDALNKGLRMATGDVVGFLHSDDLFADAECLSRVADAMSEASVDACYADLNYVRKDAPDVIVRAWKSGEFTPNKVRRGWMPPHPTLYVRRPIYERLGLFETSYRIAADYDWMIRFMGRNVNMLYIPHVQVLMRVGGASNRSLKNIIRKSREDFRALRSNGFGFFAACVALVGKNLGKLPQFLKK